jgi:hypothetical protein
MSKTLDKYLSELHRSRSQGSFFVSHHDLLVIKSEVDARIAELTAEVERLRKLVPDAYREGFGDGFYEDSASDDPMTVGKGWETSFSKIDLDAIARNALRGGVRSCASEKLSSKYGRTE